MFILAYCNFCVTLRAAPHHLRWHVVVASAIDAIATAACLDSFDEDSIRDSPTPPCSSGRLLNRGIECNLLQLPDDAAVYNTVLKSLQHHTS
jgi:hypothetical protein